MSHRNIVRAAFLADSHGLGPHWIYNQGKLGRLYPDGLLTLDQPQSSYHPNRTKGQFTHFGDQMEILLKSLVATGGWSLPVFQAVWKDHMEAYDGYVDGATKETLAHLENGDAEAASTSNDLSGASRLFPLLMLGLPLDELVEAARAQTALTHGDAVVIDSAEFFVRALDQLQKGDDLVTALETAAAAEYSALPAQDWLEQARAAAAGDPNPAAAEFGLTCHIPEAFPATLLFAFRWVNQGADLSEDGFLQILSENALAGGDTSARAMPLAALLVGAGAQLPKGLWQEVTASDSIEALLDQLKEEQPSAATSRKVSFPGAQGAQLDARLELPEGPIRATALFAHCFTCGKSSRAATAISRQLAAKGIATLRFDFTGLGNSDGDFANTSFLSNVDDLLAAADFLRGDSTAPTLLVGHSLGGAAVLAAASRIPEVTSVVTIGAPSDPAHVTDLFADSLPAIEEKGETEVSLGGRPFRIGKKFLTDLVEHNQASEIAKLQRTLLIMHSPTDQIVGIENAGEIYSAAKHPKSFISLPQADHLLLDPVQADYVAELIASWLTTN